MAEDDKIKYSDIIQPDDSIEKLIKQLTEFGHQYEIVINAIRAGADRIAHSIKSVSGATSDGRKKIDEAAASASRLERAQKELAFAVSDTGKQVAWLKAQTSSANKSTVEHQKYIKQAISSYDRLRSDLKQTVDLYKSLTAEERSNSDMGQQLLADIINLKKQIKALDDQMRPHIATLTEVEKAEQKLAYLRSSEGQKLLQIKAQIAEITGARKQQKAATDPLTQAEEKLAYARSEENTQLKLYSTRIREANQVAQLQAQIANSAEGSYNRLSAQYALNKIRLNQMSGAQRDAADSGKKLEEETLVIYQQMIKLQEATGNYRLSVGNYKKTWDGLGFSIVQVVRELPAAAVSLNTFFLGISNNIPLVVDEINRLRIQNKALKAEGKETVNITKSIISSLFGWNTALIVLLTVFSMFGKEIITWVGQIFRGRAAVLSMGEAIKNVTKQLETTNASYGQNIVTLKQLQSEWKNLKTTADKTQWITDNKTEFDKLGISITDATDAENIFVNNTQAVIDALKLRAKAAAASELASKKYEEALITRNKAELKETKLENEGVTAGQRVAARLYGTSTRVEGTNYTYVDYEESVKNRIRDLKDQADAAEAAGDAYFDLAAGYEAAAKAGLESAGIEGPHKNPKNPKEPKDGQRDLTDTVNRMSLSVQKKYEESITALERDEYAKRRKETVDAANAKIRELQETYRKNVDYLNDEENKYKDLTEEEKKLVEQAQENIRKTITNTQEQLNYDLDQIEKDRQINELKILEETIQLRLEAVKKGSLDELRLRLESIRLQQQIALLENSKKPISQRQSVEDINSGFIRQVGSATVEFDMSEFEQQQALEEARFNIVKRSDAEITKFKLQQEKERWEKQIQLTEAGALDWSQAQIDAAKAIVLGIDRELAEVDNFMSNVGKKGLGTTLLEKLGFDDDQIDALREATDIVVEQLQSIVEAEIELAEKAVEAADARVEAAQKAYDAEVEARVNGYANDVATAKKELELEKKNQREKQKELEAAQRRQESLNSITQASSLITASANLWSAFSSIPIVGPALALAAIATMWTSFAVAKVKAKQVTQSQEYGEGGLEFLEGGSHASGNDIDLGVNNKKRRRMRAEGGEALAIINRRRTRKYRKVLPDIIDSLNKGTFEDKYVNVFNTPDRFNVSFTQSNVDLSRIEDDVRSIRKSNETKYYTMPDGSTVIQHKNVKRIIKN